MAGWWKRAFRPEPPRRASVVGEADRGLGGPQCSGALRTGSTHLTVEAWRVTNVEKTRVSIAPHVPFV